MTTNYAARTANAFVLATVMFTLGIAILVR
jgi:hypothetical protein